MSRVAASLRLFRALCRSTSGNVSLLMAGGLMMMSGAAALGVDTATFYVSKRQAQGVADAAALAAAVEPTSARSRAQAAVSANAMQGLRLVEAQPGVYTPDASVASERRFVAGADHPNGAAVTVEAEVPTYFARIFGVRSATIRASSKASRVDLAAISIGSRLAAVNGGMVNTILSQLAGVDLQLSAVDYTSLASANLDLLGFTDAVRAQAELTGSSFADVLGARVTIPEILAAMSLSVTTPSTASLLRTLATRVPGGEIRLGDLIDLGPLGTAAAADPHRAINVDAFSLLRAVLETRGSNRRIETDLGLTLPGISSSRLQLAVGARASSSPWLSVGQGNEVTVRTAQTRLYLDARLLPSLLPGVTGLRVPILIELAGAEATLASLSCSAGRSNPTAALDVTPSVARVAIAEIDPSAIHDFTRALSPQPAVVAGIPGVSITGSADVTLGGGAAQRVNFSSSDIANHTVQTVSANNLSQGLASSLISRVRLDASVLGLNLGASAVTNSVGAVLSTVAPALDQLTQQVTALAGVSVGQADTWINGARCGTPMLVA